MNVLELAVTADAESAEAVAAVFNEFAYGGAVVEQTITPEVGQTIDPARPFTVRAFLLMDETVELKRAALENAVWHLGQLRPLGELQIRELEEADWANAWKKFYSIVHLGKRVVIKPTWLNYSPHAEEVVIELDPGMAFGTGLHPTTRLCLAALEQYLTPGARMLDLGTGSGILAIGGAKLGASAIDARDIDPIAVETATKNVQSNRVESIVTVQLGSISLDDPALGFDLVTANILAETIAELARALRHQLAPNGILIASGILVEKGELVKAALRQVELRVIESMQESDWLALVATKSQESTVNSRQ